MPFKVMARTLLHLGSELISSDAVAFYELIKNAFDASQPDARKVWIRVGVCIPHRLAMEIREDILTSPDARKNQATTLKVWSTQLLDSIISDAPNKQQVTMQIKGAKTCDDLLNCIEEANYIEFHDQGSGMTLSDLENIFLTIGTRNRLAQREQRKRDGADSATGNTTAPPILGEKGVGRLSVMRLGRRLHVETTTSGELHQNNLHIDWDWFSHASDQYLEEVEVKAVQGLPKSNPIYSGTTIRISGLLSEWNAEKLRSVVNQELSKLTDPFRDISVAISIRYNGELIAIPRFNEILFDHAHASVEGEFTVDKQGTQRLAARMDYKLKKKEKSFEISGPYLLSVVSDKNNHITERTLALLGPFRFKFYWFNRRILTAIDGIGDLKQVRKLIAAWAGGLLVYRDGFRVFPYGNMTDDWLGLDPISFSQGGYKLNRVQIIGLVEITSLHNPKLIDQTNREGLRDCHEKEALKLLLQHVIMNELKNFLDKVDDKKQTTPVDFAEIRERVAAEEKTARENVDYILKKYPALNQDRVAVKKLKDFYSRLHAITERVQDLASSQEVSRGQLVHLAGLGLMVEVIAHELNRAVSHALSTLVSLERKGLSPNIEKVLRILEVQLKTIEKRLRILEPMNTAARQIKEKFELVSWLKDLMDSHGGQFARHEITSTVVTDPPNMSVEIRAVKGMIVQIIENLVSNSVYWIKQYKKLHKGFRGKIDIIVHVKDRKLQFSDNGPGIPPAVSREVFEPFVTYKPPGEGKGLGLYISREIAAYHGATLNLVEQHTVHPSSYNTFVLALEGEVA